MLFRRSTGSDQLLDDVQDAIVAEDLIVYRVLRDWIFNAPQPRTLGAVIRLQVEDVVALVYAARALDEFIGHAPQRRQLVITEHIFNNDIAIFVIKGDFFR